MHKRFDAVDQPVLLQRYNAGETLKAIARDYGTTPATVGAEIRRAGGTIRRRGNDYRVWTEEEIQLILAMRSEGHTHLEIARLVSAHVQIIGCLLRAHGVHAKRMPSKTNGRIHSGGYWLRYVTSEHRFFCMANRAGYIFEHRLVMAERLGRPLAKSETVHHVDGDGSNNDLANLQLRHGMHGKGRAMRCRSCGSIDVMPVPLHDIVEG